MLVSCFLDSSCNQFDVWLGVLEGLAGVSRQAALLIALLLLGLQSVWFVRYYLWSQFLMRHCMVRSPGQLLIRAAQGRQHWNHRSHARMGADRAHGQSFNIQIYIQYIQGLTGFSLCRTVCRSGSPAGCDDCPALGPPPAGPATAVAGTLPGGGLAARRPADVQKGHAVSGVGCSP